MLGLDQFCENRREFIKDDIDEGSFGAEVAWDADALHVLPDSLPAEYAGPLMCGGVTVWGALSFYNVRPTDRVGVVGIGGLGHLAIQFAAKMGCEVVAFSSTESKRKEAMKFGAKEFYATKGLKDLTHVPKINQLLITTSAQPDYGMYIPFRLGLFLGTFRS
jgi:D-arabinose 1-dehydrogenase-like Zn-dependent alcohol dehydrogenase